MSTSVTAAVDLTNAVEVLVKSRERVKAYGEVFTPARMVERMLDLVATELESGPGFVDKTFFEPAAGDGNFLIAILRRKLAAIEVHYPSEEWQTESLFAVASIYGVELLPDNHAAAQASMMAEFVAFHRRHKVRCEPRNHLWRAAAHLIESNVVLGNTLTGQDISGHEIAFSWWHRVAGAPGYVRREMFTLATLREAQSGMLVFNISPTYQPCPINRVHQEVSFDVHP